MEGYGYGITLLDARDKKKNFNETLKDLLEQSGMEQYRELKEYAGRHNAPVLEYMDDFIDDYVSNATDQEGIAALLADLFNHLEKTDMFTSNGYFLVVMDTLPENEAERAMMLTKQQIRFIMAKYLTMLYDNVPCCEYIFL